MGPDAWSYWAAIGQGFVGAIRLLVTGDPETWVIIRQSLLISISATIASMVLGVPIGSWLANARFAGRGVLPALCNTGFGLRPVVVGLILSILLLRHGPLGYLNLRFTPASMMIGQFILSLRSSSISLSLRCSSSIPSCDCRYGRLVRRVGRPYERQAFERTEVRPPAPSFFSSRMSFAASARSQPLNVTIFGSSVVAFGQMIQ